jgi:uncharacterized damage-inducible protein DinB
MTQRYGTPVDGNEREVLGGFLDHYRSVMLQICEGLSDEDLARPMVPSGTSLLGMIKHLAYVEWGWFRETVAGEPVDYPFDFESDPEADLRIEPGETAEQIFELYRRACERSREILASVSLDDPASGERRPTEYNVRWIVVHMIEETARHAGHADILRELIDGKTGTGYQ